MTTPRKHYSPTFKSQVVEEVLEGNKTLAQIAAHHGLHPNVITKWKRAALTALPDTFDERVQRQITILIEQHEKEKERLYAEIGRLTTELRWLEKKSETGFAQRAQSELNRARKGAS
jgi:transposase-like protein